MNRTTISQPPLILCIDDDPAVAAGLARRLNSYHVEVSTAYFGQQGIWLAVTQHPDVILTDLRMPQGHGHYVVECLRRRPDTRDVPVIVLTGNRDRASRQRMRALGVEHYLHKPVSEVDLLRALESYITLERCAEPAAAD